MSGGGERLGDRSLYAFLTAKVPEAKRPETPVLIRAAGEVEYKNVVRGMDALTKLGFRQVKLTRQEP